MNRLRCAIPLTEALDAVTAPVSGDMPGCILAADGSQIMPDPHSAVLFGVINIGIIKSYPNQATTPIEFKNTHLLYYDELYSKSGGLLSEETISLMRDLEERQWVADQASESSPPVLALTDGPLELFREPADPATSQQPFIDYLETLRQLAQKHIMTAGYVDRPRADLLVHLLELDMFPENASVEELRLRPLQGITDAAILAPLLPAGYRSAVFGLQSMSAKFFSGDIALHFFYLNVGTSEHPWLARVEIPAWMAEDTSALELLHRTLLAQCQQMGNAPYPYVLHRAHEIALVTHDEKNHLENMVALELMKHGASPFTRSHKQILKDLTGTRTRLK